MYLADAIYLAFEEYCKEHGIDEKDFVIMLRGFDGMPARTDEEIWNLAKFADELGLREVILDTESHDVLTCSSRCRRPTGGWRSSRTSSRSTATGSSRPTWTSPSPTWKEDPTPVLDTIRGYFPPHRRGLGPLRFSRSPSSSSGQAAQDAFRAKLATDEERATFERMLKARLGVYHFQEDHGFYIDQGSTAVMRNAAIACGKRLFRRGS